MSEAGVAEKTAALLLDQLMFREMTGDVKGDLSTPTFSGSDFSVWFNCLSYRALLPHFPA